jgi:uncharacterized protein YyaL (SSP411 family)
MKRMIYGVMGWIFLMGISLCQMGWGQEPISVEYRKKAAEVTDSIQKNFWDKKTGLYAAALDKKEPEAVWGSGVMFSAVVAAARHDAKYVGVMRKFFDGLESYWANAAKIPGYEPVPMGGGVGPGDKYYDDNAWMVITFQEAYEVTGESRYLKRAEETLDFVMSGWDDKLGGGIWWHEKHLGDGKNTCINAPAAVGSFRMAKFSDEKESARRIADGQRLTKWTTEHLRAPNGLFGDSINVKTGVKNNDQLTYNAGLMIRAYLSLYALTGEDLYLDEATAMGKAADSMLIAKTGVYRDPLKWAHLMVEADLELYRWTHDRAFLKRAKTNCDAGYASWKKSPDKELIGQASLARELWLMADMETAEGKAFWAKSDKLKK